MDSILIQKLGIPFEIPVKYQERFGKRQKSRYLNFNGERYRIRFMPPSTQDNYIDVCPHSLLGRRCAFIFTKDQADKLEINYMKNWREVEQGGWIITDVDSPDDTFWVMQALRVNNNPAFPYITTPVGRFAKRGIIPLNANDRTNWNNVGYDNDYGNGAKRKSLSKKNLTMAFFIAAYIYKYGKYNESVIRKAYEMTHDYSCGNYRARQIMRNEMVQQEVARKLKELCNDQEVNEKWVVTQLKNIGEDEKSKDRMEAVSIIARIHSIPIDGYREIEAPKNKPKELTGDIEEAEILEELESKVG